MRLTNALLKQHIGWHTKMKWLSLRNRTVRESRTIDSLRESGIDVINGAEAYMGAKPTPPPKM